MLKIVIIEEDRLNRKKLVEDLSTSCQFDLLFSVDTLQSFQVAMLTSPALPPDLVLMRTSDSSIINDDISKQVKEYCPGCILVQYCMSPLGESLYVHSGKVHNISSQGLDAFNMLQALLCGLGGLHEKTPTPLSIVAKSAIQSIKNKVSPREMQVIEGLAFGLTYAEIGKKMFISINTIRNYVKNIYEKLDVKNKVQLAQKYYGVIESAEVSDSRV